jgi:pyruvate/2-oxoglutarate dehydrogenase complex dihydrolipoamide acyltransferase (E2) component
MAVEIKMPALSPTMEEGKLARWLVKEGDEVRSGDILAEIETDKATMEFEAVDEGTVGKIVVPEGTEGVRVGTVIATIEGEGEESADPAPPPPAKDVPGEGKDVGREPAKAESGTAQLAVPLSALAGSRPIPPYPPAPTCRPSPCARPCATPWPKRCAATSGSS